MLLGYNTNGFTSHSLDDALRVIGGLGYRSVAITLDHAALNPYGPDLAGEIDRVGALLRELELVPVIETGARFLLDPWRKHRPTLMDQDDADRRRRADFLARAIDIAARLGAPAVSLWSGTAPAGADVDTEALDARLAAGLLPLCRRAADAGLVVALEPEPGMHVAAMADFDRIEAAIDHPACKLTLDVGHAHLTEEDAVDVVRRYGPRIANVHLEGMRRPVHDHLLPWEGDLDVAGVLRALEGVWYQGPATFELSRHSHDAVEVARRAIAHVAAL
ncbi:MAG TPA: sugar phosphate isomerase/epimerase [Kofleriaceae bacterium]|nr:sugar phosphate isomerase/epimerase [Kofleriaceae bacterium]